MHGGRITKWDAVVTAKNDDRGTLVAFTHEENCHTSKRIDKIDLGDVHGAAEKVRLAANIPQWLNTG